MINTFLYSVYGQGHGARHATDPKIAAYRNEWIDALVKESEIEVVLTLGTLANGAWTQYVSAQPLAAPPAGITHVQIIHPTFPNSASASGHTTLAAAMKKMLEDWNIGLTKVRAALAHPDADTPLVPFGTTFEVADHEPIPEADLPAGSPPWMRSLKSWASRTGADETEKRATIVVTVPHGERPF
jgi:uracil-DNA glycosylase